MAFKISNETKVGALTAISITMLILGINFLKGKNPIKKSRFLYAKFEKIDGLLPANAVMMNGLSIGSVYETQPGDNDLNWVLVSLRLEENVNIPVNSFATVKTSLLDAHTLEILKGDSKQYLKPGDTLQTIESGGLLGNAMNKLEPTQRNLDKVLKSVDTLVGNVNDVLDERSKADLRQTLANLSSVSHNLTLTTASLNNLLNAQTGVVTKTFNNLESFSKSLSALETKLPAIASNLETTTDKLARIEFDKTISSLNKAVQQLDQVLKQANNTNGTVGALLNDKKLYNNLSTTVNSLNLLMQDLRLHPKRYVNISVFGKKDKSDPLMRPLAEDSVTQEQTVPKQ